MSNEVSATHHLYATIKTILDDARNHVYQKVNFIMVEAYWNIGKQIVEEEQNGKDRAEYGSYLIKELSKQLSQEFGKGYSQQNLRNMRQFYTLFSIRSALRSELTWTHYRLLLRIENRVSREWYMNEAVEANWSTRALERQIGSHYYERIVASRDKSVVQAESEQNTKGMKLTPKDIIKDPYVLEFLDLKDNKNFREGDLESALIDKVQDFLLELGRGFAFVARQKHIRTEHSDYYIDLVFYNYILKCFVIIDLKSGKLTHQDIGQIDMYVNMFNDLEKAPEDNPTIGIVLCTDKDHTVVKYSSIDNEKLFVSKYKLYLPTEEELRAEIEREVLGLQFDFNRDEDD
jgi:predicted nuclease of restriction endonuclease-like (RecB) superfamily